MSDRTPPGEPEHGSTPPPPPSWGTPPPEQPSDQPFGQPPGRPYGQQSGPYPSQPPQGPYGGGFPMGPVTNQKAQWSLAVGLLAVPLACCSALLGLVGIVAIVLGVQARREIAAGHGQQTGEGLAMTGIVAGALAIVIAIIATALLAVLFVAGDLYVSTS